MARQLVSIFLLLILAGAPTQAKPTWSEAVAKSLQKQLKKSGIDKGELGLWVGYDNSSQLAPILEINSEKLFIPASLTKMITAATTLDTIPLNYKFKTQLLTKGKIKKRILKGNLAVKGFGDPTFVSESMWVLVNKFARTGIKKVEGDLILDDTYFDHVRYDRDRENSRVDRAYDAPIGALSFNWNSVNVFVRPGKKSGEAVRVFADPASPYVKVINRATTVKGARRAIRVSRVEDLSRIGDNIIVSGELGVLAKELVKYKSITQPEFWTGLQLQEFLKRRGITVTGQVLRGVIDSSYRVLAEHESEKLVNSVSAMMKFSNNFVAEMLTKHLVAYTKGAVGNMPEGLHFIRKFLISKIGLKGKHFNLVNPSGLTRENQFRPLDFAKLLHYMKNSFKVYPEFLASLPIAGVDGTLKERMNNTKAKSWVRAKTGMLNGVLGLSGYAGRVDGQVIIFSFMYNGKQERINKVALLFDRMSARLVD